MSVEDTILFPKSSQKDLDLTLGFKCRSLLIRFSCVFSGTCTMLITFLVHSDLCLSVDSNTGCLFNVENDNSSAGVACPSSEDAGDSLLCHLTYIIILAKNL